MPVPDWVRDSATFAPAQSGKASARPETSSWRENSRPFCAGSSSSCAPPCTAKPSVPSDCRIWPDAGGGLQQHVLHGVLGVLLMAADLHAEGVHGVLQQRQRPVDRFRTVFAN